MTEREEWAAGELKWIANGLCVSDFEGDVRAFGLRATLSVLKDDIMQIVEALEEEEEWEE